MKQVVLCLAALLWSLQGLQAQSQKALEDMLKRDLNLYRQYTLATQFDSSLQYMPPKMFDIIPRDSLRESMVQTMDNPFMAIRMTSFDFDPKHQPKIEKADAYHWAYVPYTGGMKLTLKSEPELKAMIVPILKAQFGMENVQMENDSTMQITLINKEILAIKDPNVPYWWLIEDKRGEKGRSGEQQKQLFEMVIPEAVLKAIDKR